MVQVCVAPNCSSRFVAGGRKGFHRFPRDSARRIQWILAVKKKNWKPLFYDVVCSDHFSKESYTIAKDGVKMLKRDAIPTIFQFGRNPIRQIKTEAVSTSKSTETLESQDCLKKIEIESGIDDVKEVEPSGRCLRSRAVKGKLTANNPSPINKISVSLKKYERKCLVNRCSSPESDGSNRTELIASPQMVQEDCPEIQGDSSGMQEDYRKTREESSEILEDSPVKRNWIKVTSQNNSETFQTGRKPIEKFCRSKGNVSDVSFLSIVKDLDKINVPSPWTIRLLNEWNNRFIYINEVRRVSGRPVLLRTVEMLDNMQVSVYYKGVKCKSLRYLPATRAKDLVLIVHHLETLDECVGSGLVVNLSVETVPDGEKRGDVWFSKKCDGLVYPKNKDQICRSCAKLRLKKTEIDNLRSLKKAQSIYVGLREKIVDF